MLGLYPPVKLEGDFRSDHHVFFFFSYIKP